MDEICKVHQFLMFSADTPMQHAFAEHMTDPQTWLSLSAFYQRKRDLLHSCWPIRRFRCCRAPGRSSCWRITAISAMSATASW
jgi:aspartate/methionine/tyrosine aminotransferase